MRYNDGQFKAGTVAIHPHSQGHTDGMSTTLTGRGENEGEAHSAPGRGDGGGTTTLNDRHGAGKTFVVGQPHGPQGPDGRGLTVQVTGHDRQPQQTEGRIATNPSRGY